jgi:aldehyde dehydrogenase
MLAPGEVCTCPSRILVQESIADEFIERLNAKLATIKVFCLSACHTLSCLLL